MKNTGTVNYQKMSNQAQAAVDVTVLYYRGALAEALLNGKAPDAPKFEKLEGAPARDEKSKPPNAVGAMYETLGDLNRRQRRRAARMLMTEDMGLHKLSARDRSDLENWVQPNGKAPYWQRVKLSDVYDNIYKHPSKDELKDEQFVTEWQHGILRGFLPGIASDNDGRPEDAEPGTPDPTDQPPSTPMPPASPVTPMRRFLHFNVEQLACISATGRERGADEINYGAVAVDGPMASFVNPNVAGAVLTDLLDAGSFDEGDVRDLSTLPPLHSWDLGSRPLPHLFVMHLGMAEMDTPGFLGNSFQGLMGALLYDIQAEITQHWWFWAANFLTMGFVGTLLGTVGGVIGAVIGGIVGGVLSLLWSYLFVGNGDDFFRPETVWLQLQPNPISAEPFNGSRRTATFDVQLSGNGGRYGWEFHWAIEGFANLSPGDRDEDV